MIGNSSSGIIESSYLNVNTINLGNRQNGRLCNNNVFHSDFSVKNIQKLINKLINKNKAISLQKKLYGDGNAYRKAYQIIDGLLKRKKLQACKEFNLL